MFDFLRRRRLLRRGLASKKTRRRRTRNELLRSLEAAGYVKLIVLAGFIAGLAFLIFSGQQPEPTKNFVIALLFFATAIVQLWINQPRTFSQNSRVLLVFGTIFVQLAATKLILVLSSEHAFKFLTPEMGWLLAPYAVAPLVLSVLLGRNHGIITAMIVGGALPMLEHLFQITTDVSWLELSDLNHPLLRRMTIEAPGTYHHSLVVANLAEAAAEKIGANATLCRVCSYFHDVG